MIRLPRFAALSVIGAGLLMIGLAAFSAPVGAADCGRKFELCRAQIAVGGLQATIYANAPLRQPHPEIRRALVIVHGTDGNADNYFGVGLRAAAQSGHESDMLVVAPHFPEVAKADGADKTNLVWDRRSNWRFGDLSTDAIETRAFSFSVMDEILAPLADRALYPNLSSIVIAGHSAGAQYVQRYAFASRDIAGLPPITYVVANPSSVVYLDARRPVPGSLTDFAVPPPSNCATNRYGYGLDQPNDYVKRDPAETEIARYRARKIVYLAGEADTDPNAANLSRTCAAMAQGPMRFARMTAFANYMSAFYAPNNHRYAAVPGVGHNNARMFLSPQGMAALFGD